MSPPGGPQYDGGVNGIQPYLLAFIPLFVAIDAAAVVPPFLALTEGESAAERRHTLKLSVATALVVGLAFLALGRGVFAVLGVTPFDFQLAGGAVLFIISVRDLLHAKDERRLANNQAGVVPLGVPLIVGPAVLTTLLSSTTAYGLLPTLASFVVNMAIAWIILAHAEWVTRVIGISGTRAFAKIMSLLLASIGVMMMRRGITGILAERLLG
jgi:multiple antibiotic resistance protein